MSLTPVIDRDAFSGETPVSRHHLPSGPAPETPGCPVTGFRTLSPMRRRCPPCVHTAMTSRPSTSAITRSYPEMASRRAAHFDASVGYSRTSSAPPPRLPDADGVFPCVPPSKPSAGRSALPGSVRADGYEGESAGYRFQLLAESQPAPFVILGAGCRR